MPIRSRSLTRQVQLHVPEAVDVEHGRVDDAVVDDGLGQLEPHERVRRERRPELRGLDAEREVRRGGREEIAPVERPRHRLERVRGIGDLVRALDPAQLGGGDEQPVVGADEEPPFASRTMTRPPRAADSGIDDGEVHAGGHVRGACCAGRARPGARPAARSRA